MLQWLWLELNAAAESSGSFRVRLKFKIKNKLSNAFRKFTVAGTSGIATPRRPLIFNEDSSSLMDLNENYQFEQRCFINLDPIQRRAVKSVFYGKP